jgi:integrase
MKKRKDGRYEDKYIWNGKTKSAYGKTEEEVKEKIKKIKAEIELDMYFEPSKIKLETWLKTWLFDFKRNSIKPKTLASYEEVIRLYINPGLGPVSLDKLNTVIIQKFINDLKKSPRTVKYTHIVLKMALRHAVNIGMLNKNVAENISLPRNIKKDIQILRKEDMKKFLDAIKGSRYYCVFLLAITTGMRRGEILALKWQDIDFTNDLVKVSKTMDRVKVFDEAKIVSKLLFGDCKTQKSNRVLPILPDVKNALRTQYTRNRIAALSRGEKICFDDYIFVTNTGNNLTPRNLLRTFDAILKKAGIPHIKFHALRHTFATLGLENGVDIKTMQELLGHSSITITADIYTHVQLHQKQEALNKIKHIF